MVRAEYSTTKQDAFQCSEFPNHLFTRRFTWTDTHMIICSCTDERRSKITAVISEIVKYLQSTKNSTCLDVLQQRASMCEIIRKSYLLKIKLKVRRWDSKKNKQYEFKKYWFNYKTVRLVDNEAYIKGMSSQQQEKVFSPSRATGWGGRSA